MDNFNQPNYQNIPPASPPPKTVQMEKETSFATKIALVLLTTLTILISVYGISWLFATPGDSPLGFVGLGFGLVFAILSIWLTFRLIKTLKGRERMWLLTPIIAAIVLIIYFIFFQQIHTNITHVQSTITKNDFNKIRDDIVIKQYEQNSSCDKIDGVSFSPDNNKVSYRCNNNGVYTTTELIDSTNSDIVVINTTSPLFKSTWLNNNVIEYEMLNPDNSIRNYKYDFSTKKLTIK